VTEEVLASGLEAAKTWIRESIVLQRELVAAFVAARGTIETMEYSTFSDYGDDVFARVEAIGTADLAAANVLSPKAERNAGLAEVTESILSQLADEFDGRQGEVKAAVAA